MSHLPRHCANLIFLLNPIESPTFLLLSIMDVTTDTAAHKPYALPMDSQQCSAHFTQTANTPADGMRDGTTDPCSPDLVNVTLPGLRLPSSDAFASSDVFKTNDVPIATTSNNKTASQPSPEPTVTIDIESDAEVIEAALTLMLISRDDSQFS